MSCENRLLLWGKSIGLMYSDEHQKTEIDSTDKFFDQLASLADKDVLWGGQRVQFGLGGFASSMAARHIKKWATIAAVAALMFL